MNIPRDVFYYEILDYIPLEDVANPSLVQRLAPRRSKKELLEFIATHPDPYLIDVYLQKYPKWELLEHLIVADRLPEQLANDPLIDILPIEIWIHTANADRTVNLLEAMLERDMLTETMLLDLEEEWGFSVEDPELEGLLGPNYERYAEVIAELLANFYPTFA